MQENRGFVEFAGVRIVFDPHNMSLILITNSVQLEYLHVIWVGLIKQLRVKNTAKTYI